jgi:hypothetical protein
MNTRIFKWQDGHVSGLAKHMDIILLNNDCIIYNKSLELANTIFINTRLKEKLIIHFIDNILPKLSKPINLIIAGEDYTFPNNTDLRMRDEKIKNFKTIGKFNFINKISVEKLDKNLEDKRLRQFKLLGQHKFINKIFVENLDEKLENTLPIPLGINPRECPTTIDYFLQFENIDISKPLKITNFNRTRDGKGQWEERGIVYNLCNKNWNNYYIKTEEKQHDEYLKIMGKYLFTICVHGGGLDVNPKLWEAILIGVIPIIKENKPYTDIYERLDFPVVIVKKWDIDTINEKNLLLWYNKYYSYFTNYEKRKQMLYNLTMDYWVNYVSTF